MKIRVSVALLAAASLLACQSGTAAEGPGASEPKTAAPAGPPAPAGPATITAASLRAHVEYLASDALGGRETNRDGEKKAAAYMASHFADVGLAPMPGQSGYLVDYDLVEQGFDLAATSGTLQLGGETVTLTPENDFAPFSFSAEGEAAGEIVFAGYGITAPKLGYDDYEGLDVKDKWVLVLRYHPAYGDDESKFAGTDHSYFVKKAATAVKHGAKGMLLVTGPKQTDATDDLRFGGRLALPPEDNENDRTGFGRFGGRGGNTVALAAIHVSREVGERIAAASDTTLTALQEALDGGAAPASLALDGLEATFTVARMEQPKKVTAHNVIGYLEGSDPERADEWIVVGGHYDHLGSFDGGAGGDVIYNGADDNASGTAGVLALARAFATRGERPARSILFMGFSGEEKGLLGSRALLAQELLPADKLVFMLNLDMIGRNPDEPVAFMGDGYATALSPVIEKASNEVGLDMELGGGDYAPNSDHHPFFVQHVPVIFAFSGIHEDYHQLSDHADKVAYERMEKIVKVSYQLVDAVASGDVTPQFVHRLPWLGIAMQMSGDGNGAVINEVEGESRGDKAGLTAGDVVVSLGDDAITSDDALSKHFGDIEPGATATLRVRRDNQMLEIAVERSKRGFLGVWPQAIDTETRHKHGFADDEGMLVAKVVEDGPAAKSGLKDGDILLRVAGHAVTVRTLGRRLAAIGAGEPVKVQVFRDGARIELELVLGEPPAREP